MKKAVEICKKFLKAGGWRSARHECEEVYGEYDERGVLIIGIVARKPPSFRSVFYPHFTKGFFSMAVLCNVSQMPVPFCLVCTNDH